MTDLTKLIQGKNILITGGAGAIGSYLCKILAQNNAITVFDNLDSSKKSNLDDITNVEFVNGDVANSEDVAGVFRRKFDKVFHLAACFANQNSVDHPNKDLSVNGIGTINVLEHVKRTGVEKFIYSSSSCVYGPRSGRLVETMEIRDLDTPYAISKYTGELYTKFFHEFHGVNTSIVRYFNSFGPGELPGKYRNVIPNFFKLALTNQALPITGTGEETRDFTFVEDAVQGTILSAIKEDAAGKVFNIGTGNEIKIIDLAKAINEITGNHAGIAMKERRNWDHIATRCPDISLAINVLGYEPKTNFHQGLQKTYEWIKDKV